MSGKFAGNMDVYFLLKKLDNHIQKYLPVLYKKMDIQEYSLMNLWVCDFLYDNRNRSNLSERCGGGVFD